MTRCSTLCMLALFTGCATMRHGTQQSIPVASSPSGAHVTIDGVPVGTTPLVAKVARKRNHAVSITHDTFPRVDIVLEKQLSPWVLLNWWVFYVPALVDFDNGAAYRVARDCRACQRSLRLPWPHWSVFR